MLTLSDAQNTIYCVDGDFKGIGIRLLLFYKALGVGRVKFKQISNRIQNISQNIFRGHMAEIEQIIMRLMP